MGVSLVCLCRLRRGRGSLEVEGFGLGVQRQFARIEPGEASTC